MNDKPAEQIVVGVPQQVFSQFLKDLKEKGVAADVLDRLQDLLLTRGELSEDDMKSALFPNESTPI